MKASAIILSIVLLMSGLSFGEENNSSKKEEAKESKTKAEQVKLEKLTRYYYEGYFDQKNEQWYFNKEKSLVGLELNEKSKKYPAFSNHENFFVVTYNEEGKIERVLHLTYWIRKNGKYQKPLEIFFVKHFTSQGKLDKRVTYHNRIGWNYVYKIEYFKEDKLIKEEFYKKGVILSTKEYK